jgi:hypothetical protein
MSDLLPKQQTNLLEYIGAEETNLLVSINLCRRDMDVFSKLDSLFQAPMQLINVKMQNKDDLTSDERHKITVLTLYLYVHYHLYSAMTNMLRCHLSDALSQSRKAIDAALTACRLMKEPGTLDQYVNSHADYKNVKRFIADANKKDATSYPDTSRLIDFHEICSQYGSHADVSSFIHRVELTEENEVGQALFRLLMFQKPDTEHEFRYYLVQILFAFAQMLWLFREFVGSLPEKFDKASWINAIRDLGGAIEKEGDKIAEDINKKTGD